MDCHLRTIIIASVALVALYALFLLASPVGKETVFYIHRAYVHKDIKRPSPGVVFGLVTLFVFYLGSGAVLSYAIKKGCS